MLIEGPLSIGVLDQPDQPGRELHINFTQDFQSLESEAQAGQLQSYLLELQQSIVSLAEDDPNRAGMLIVQQIAEQLYSHIKSGEMVLEETIIVELGRDYSSDSLMNLLNS